MNIYTSDANSLNLDHQALGQTDWVGSSPVRGQSVPETAAFYNYTAPVLLGQIAITQGNSLAITNAPIITGAYVLGTHS